MKDQDFSAFLEKLPQLHVLLQAEGMNCGADTWLAVHDLLLSMSRKQSLPDDLSKLAFYLAPILCKNPEQQRAFPELFNQWLGDLKSTQVTLDISDEAIKSEPIKKSAKRANLYRNIALVLLFLSLATGYSLFWIKSSTPEIQPENITPTPQLDTPKTSPLQEPLQPEIQPTPPPKPIQEKTQNDWTTPPQTPEKLILPDIWQQRLNWLEKSVPWLPSLFMIMLLIRYYRKRWVLNKGNPDNDTLIKRLRFHQPRLLFGGEKVLNALHRLHSKSTTLTHKLDVKATVEASARQAGFFNPKYLSRSESPHYLLLVRSRHTHDQSAALADELIIRFQDQGLSVEGFRFRDDPTWLVPWTDPHQPSRSLSQLAQQWPDARLIIIGESDIIFHPFTGLVKPWLDQIETWTKRAWLSSDAIDPELATWLWQKDFLILPFSSSSLENLSHWLTAWPTNAFNPLQAFEGNIQRPLPRALNLMSERWLDAVLPYGENLEAIFKELRAYLTEDGWLLFQAIAAYPEARWALTQALDFSLFDPKQDRLREIRLSHLGRLPWIRYGHLPDYLREALLKDLAKKDRQQIRDVYAKLLFLPEESGQLVLPIAAPTRRKLKRFLLESLHLNRRPSTLDDPIFINLLLGDKLSLLDFHLSRALASILPGARLRLNP